MDAKIARIPIIEVRCVLSPGDSLDVREGLHDLHSRLGDESLTMLLDELLVSLRSLLNSLSSCLDGFVHGSVPAVVIVGGDLLLGDDDACAVSEDSLSNVMGNLTGSIPENLLKTFNSSESPKV